MSWFRFAVAIPSLNESFRKAIKRLRDWGVHGAEWDAVGDLAPDQLSQSGRRELRHLLQANNLQAAGVRVPMAKGLDQPEGLEARMDLVRRALELAYDVDSRIVVLDPGTLPEDPASPQYTALADVLHTLGRYGERVGSVLALETGATPPMVWKQLLERLQSGGLGISLDPATLVAHGYEPEEAVASLYEHLCYVQAREARRGSRQHPAQEVPLGHGHVDWVGLTNALRDAGYRGWLSLKRRPGLTAQRDLEEGLRFLRRLLGG
ncbi:MAG: sugar phosphate isomerase/epimerase family protein [Gemmatales bacterium]|nr:sugar phosphate isomerase/epimerase [Gemmatales bacterium]MDW7993241.1 sugar phosphate isomerase/epimerase family protein [Gemmatales bacterium]